MGVLAAVTTIWTVAKAAEGIIELIIRVKDALKQNQVKQNRKDRADLIEQLLRSFDEVEAACKSIKPEWHELSNATIKLQSTIRIECGNNQIQRQLSDYSDKVEQALSQKTSGSDPSFDSGHQSSTKSLSNTKDCLVEQLQKLSKSLETVRPNSQRVPSPAYPDHLASNTHRPHLSDTANGLPEAISRTQRILDTYTTDSAGNTAHSLDNLSIALMDVGLIKQASQMSSWSVRIYESVLGLKWDSNFAVALRNHSNHLNALGRVEEAVKHAQHAVEIYSRLSDRLSDPGRAGALDSLATYIFILQRNDEALAASHQAVQISRDLLQQQPQDEGLSADLAMFLANRANTLHALKQQEAALEDAAESRNIYRVLRSHSSDRYTAEYADSLRIYSEVLFRLNRSSEALQPIHEAVTLWTQLNNNRLKPDVYSPNLARGLLSLSYILSALGRHLGAAVEIEKAVDIFRRLATQSPEMFNPEYARSLHHAAQVHIDHQRHQDAILFLNEALLTYKTLSLDNCAAEFALTYNRKHLCMTRLKDHEGAVAASRSAIEILKQAPQSDKNNNKLTASRYDLAFALYNEFVDRCSVSPTEALVPGREAVGRFRFLVAQAPDNTICQRLVEASISLSFCYSKLEEHGRAVKYGELALETSTKLTDTTFRKNALNRLSSCYRHMGDETRAAEAQGKASMYE
ncbi:hypothetical protein C8F04DRAFT_1186169 [Mycena alexandri]|uniref:TPR-like protein n=1 Tax=Mycena alexandri TaxID=1745969 RepID=A0AAD6WZL6_9AGAR|nr:hypothetical protein C8F04DRAFT_1186169 [Mycena alexandri]